MEALRKTHADSVFYEVCLIFCPRRKMPRIMHVKQLSGWEKTNGIYIEVKIEGVLTVDNL